MIKVGVVSIRLSMEMCYPCHTCGFLVLWMQTVLVYILCQAGLLVFFHHCSIYSNVRRGQQGIIFSVIGCVQGDLFKDCTD